MIWLTGALLLIALGGGSYVASLHFRGAPPPGKIALAHGVLGTLGAALLAVLAIQRADAALLPALAVYGVLIAGGLYLFSFRKKEAGPPRSAIAIHGAVAIIAFGLFVYGGFIW